MPAWLDTAGAGGACRTVPGMLSPIPASRARGIWCPAPGAVLVPLRGWPRSPRCFRRLWSRRWKRRTRTPLANAFLGPGSEREAPAFISSSSGFVNKVEGKSRKAAVSKVQALGEGAAERIRGCRDQTKSGQTFPQLPPAFVFSFILEN